MSIKKFSKKYPSRGNGISKTVLRWENERIIDEVLGYSLAPNLVLADILIGDGLVDVNLNPEIIGAMELIKREAFSSTNEVKEFLISKMMNGDESIGGVINQLQGAIAELRFEDLSNGSINLAHVTNQEAVDAVRFTDTGKVYIQIKVYSDADKVIEKILEVNEKIDLKEVNWINADGSHEILGEYPNFAVNSEIFDEVREKANRLGLANKIEDLGLSREEIRDGLNGQISEINSEFFESIAGPVVIATVIQSFFQWYAYRDLNFVLSSLPKNVTINTIGTLGAFAGRSLVLEGALLAELEFLACVASPVVGVAFAVVARGLATRISERMDYAERLETGNLRLTELVAKVG